MKTLKKKFLAAFGNTYELEIISKEKAWDIIDGIDQLDVLENLISKHHSQGETLVYLNLESAEVEYYHFIGNTDLQKKGHLVMLESLSGNIEEGLSIEDFLSEEEIENVGERDTWDVIKELNDYDERLINAWKFHYNGFNEISIKEQINEIY